MNKAELDKIREMHNRGYKPGNLDVEEMLTHIDALEHELSALRETQIPLLKRAASMLAMLADRDTKGRRTIDEFADELNEMRLRLEKTPPSALRETQKAREAALLKKAAVVAGNTITEEGRSEELAAIVMRSVRELRPDSALDDLLREARLAEAEWWASDRDYHTGKILGCKRCQRLSALRAPLEPEGK